eukprot:CAMPEP_0169091280 /NCGR_PEP_ID=MMETSP1015-20121227/16277_1 /TAXON_ID=342587 /ORGANISM="Karlodinium micrum, Strain CCMP2283" /LENGTH=607 /DNA_ID=CAMNT_0009151759 /DNA_START=69 /DNA_END=1889 /DNA_ORIENTATION=-
MKFGKHIGGQQEADDDLHYIDYKLLKQRIKDVVARLEVGELPEALTANTAFEEELVAEIRQVNTCFETSQKQLLDRISRLSEELTQKGTGCIVLLPTKGAEGAACEPCAQQHQYAPFYRLVQMLQDMDRLRKYAVWNAVAVVKILKKRRKQTHFGLEDSSVERAGWLSRQNFFNGSEFAELHVALESLGRALVFSEFGPGSGDAPLKLQQTQKDPQQCPICLDTIYDVVELSCNHRFCWKCFVLGPIAFQPGEYRMTHCPICRREATRACEDNETDLSVSNLAPGSESTLSQFLHTYFASEPAVGAPPSQMRDGDGPESETIDVVATLLKVVLADTSWQRTNQPARADDCSLALVSSANASSSEQPLSGALVHSQQASPISNDFFNTLPLRSVQQDERTQMYTAQKLQWLQLASSGDPFAMQAETYCPICSEPLLLEPVMTTPCKHQFHEICLRRLEMPICPLCPAELPFSCFLPSNHPLVERGFKVVPACQYKPRFPGGPSRGSCGYPLHQPPPITLLGPAGKSMRSYLHRVPPTGSVDDDDDEAQDSYQPAEESPRNGEDEVSLDSQSSASDSSSEESDDNDRGCHDEDDLEDMAALKNSKKATW